MAKEKNTEALAVVAFLAGAAVAAGVTLLLTPKSGREVREKIGEATDDALDKIRTCAREAKFKASKKTKADAFTYDGGDCWI